jgi:phospholipid/cholesterol/gamma-HCH transport system ATP-binding protein
MSESHTASPPAIEFRNVSWSFDGVRSVVSHVSLAVRAGEMLVVTGNSAAGKSVLLRLALGFYAPDEGEILIEGRHIEHLGEAELLELRSKTLGMVFQEDALFSSLSVYDNAAFRLVEHGWAEQDVDRAVREILAFVGLENDTDKLPEELSIGMRRRLELARALVGWPPVMLFDEPTSGLDPITSKYVMDLVIRARDVHQIASLYVTKELHEIPYLASHYAARGAGGDVEIREGNTLGAATTRVLVLDGGEAGFLGTAEEFATSERPSVTRMTHPEIGSVVTLEQLRAARRGSTVQENHYA